MKLTSVINRHTLDSQTSASVCFTEQFLHLNSTRDSRQYFCDKLGLHFTCELHVAMICLLTMAVITKNELVLESCRALKEIW